MPEHNHAVVHVIDDDVAVRGAVARPLAASGYEVRQYGSGGEYLLSPPDERPGCLLLDLSGLGGGGLALQDALRWHPPYAKPVIFLCGEADVRSSVQAIKSGACDVLVKPVDRTALLSAVGQALERDWAARTGRERRLVTQQHVAGLSQRERTVLDGVMAGKLNKQIADELGVTERTVKSDRSRVFHLFGVHSLSELMPLIAELDSSVDSGLPAGRGADARKHKLVERPSTRKHP